MSFAPPRNIPNFGSGQRQYEDNIWSSTGRSRFSNGNSESLNPFAGQFSFQGGKELPLYKDKPYNYPASSRRRSKRLWAGITLVLVVICYLFWPSGGRPKLTHKSGFSRDSKIWKSASQSEKHWLEQREKVVEAMEKSWAGYEKHAWGYDEYHPNSKSGRQMVPPTGLGWIIVDALDTLMLMNLTTQLQHARQWVSTTLTYDLDHDVNTFETTIRMLGGFLAAHYLQTAFPKMCPIEFGKGGEDLYLEKATDLAERILGAFDSPSGIPYASFNPKSMKGLPSHSDGGASSLAEATSLQLEFKYLANLTGEANYWEKVEKVMEVVDATGEKDGLKGIYVNPATGSSSSNNIRLGSRGDSYYEYLIKQYLQTKEPIYQEMWTEALNGIKKHLITYSTPSNFTVLAERPWGLEGEIEPKMDHLVCFMPGTLALSATGGLSVAEAKKSGKWTAAQQADLDIAIELMKTCWGMYKITKTGLAPEITYFHIPDHPQLYNPSGSSRPIPPSLDIFERDHSAEATWRTDFIVKPADTHNLQRPETVESLFYLWRITGDETYRRWGEEMFTSFMKYTEAPDGAGYTSISDVNVIPPPTRNNMESFWPAETLKYFYLLFSPNDILPLTDVVFNTEAHAFPRFQMGKLFKTGWARKKRGADGMIIREVENHDQKTAKPS
ncbi:endoplasmic reticulum mannosyl-oligosaccharide 1,2-alpha-mannosidase [Microthyrium microscopicum]|uniref:alpha-1,2-Mannosidase n=1 Tax=Microthyrium microscopicum TaxID=703497 RepID=A0A6A6UCQ2_9PEZI|nr:endoplasmic reticulum mannosyl-oligosaccharide 1,2-alpha-mannosidase [Microthyrium microscopicum]